MGADDMGRKTPGTRRTRRLRRASYRSAARRVFVEPLDNTIAVRYREGSRDEINKMLRSLGPVRSLDSQRLLIVESPKVQAQAAAVKRVIKSIGEAGLEFATPLLRDPDTNLKQVLTDEITVRFKKPAVAKRQLRSLEQRFGVKVARQNEFVPNQFTIKLDRPKGLDTLRVASKLDAEEEIEFASPNFLSDHIR